ncbi:hypothetical protein DENIS_0054 [Desulfonema ishimotonii]|uniref:PAS domain S-box protein n=2 Tax=Desulfonema ishimotonii TaxID=45657 RepID=A0A401FQ54_9BACT|nr:hypothetical protein DENIS_0054 [Desulfonema ishimotonii]
MVLIGFGLATFYWICESFINIFLSDKINIFELILGTTIDEIWTRIIVLCLFIIFGSHAQFTIDNRKKAENALKKSEARYRTLVENIPIGICRITPGPDGRFLMSNPAFLKMFGFRSDTELNHINFSDIYIKPEECDTFSDLLLQRGSLAGNEMRFRRKNGTPIWISATARVVYHEETREVACFDCTFEDIDERKKAEIKIREDAETRRRFERLLSPDLAEMVVSGDLKVEKGGEDRVATVLFADIRGFTSMSENTRAAEVLQMLNEYFEAMVEIVFRYEGTVDKFIGDAIMVIWGAPVTHADDPYRAVRAATDMRATLTDFNKKRNAQGKQPLRIGIGINTGRLVAGYIGSNQTMSYSVIGDTVNTASRLCSAAQAGKIIISESTYRCVRDHFSVTKLNPIRVKGKLNPIQIFNINGTVSNG